MNSYEIIVYATVIYSLSRANSLPALNETFSGDEELFDCKGKRLEFNKRMKEVMCVPRKSLQKIKTEPWYFYYPNVVLVNKCDGYCSDFLSCKPVKTRKKLVLVKRSREPLSESMSCYRAYIEEHTQCRCSCKVTNNDCNQYQEYKEDQCACTCTNLPEQENCSYRTKMVWNPERCKCTCAVPEQECTTGWEWIPSVCRCGKLMPWTRS